LIVEDRLCCSQAWNRRVVVGAPTSTLLTPICASRRERAFGPQPPSLTTLTMALPPFQPTAFLQVHFQLEVEVC
jgi:hypothetical protein